MKTFIKNIGLIVLLIGLVIVIITSIGTVQENTGLWVGAILIIVGLLAYIIINRYIE